MKGRPLALFSACFMLSVGGALAVNKFSSSAEIPTKVRIESALAFDGSSQSEIFAFADDVAVVRIGKPHASVDAATRMVHETEVLYSFKGLLHDVNRVLVRQTGGVFDTPELGLHQVVTDQELLEEGGVYVVALRYADGQGMFTVVDGVAAVNQVESLDEALAETAMPSQKALDWSSLPYRPPLELIPNEPVILEIPQPAVAKPDDRPPTAEEERWIAGIVGRCESSLATREKIAAILTDAATVGELTKEQVSELTAAMLVLETSHGETQSADRSAVRAEMVTALEEVNASMEVIASEIDRLEGLRGDALRQSIAIIDLEEEVVELAWTRLGTQACRRD